MKYNQLTAAANKNRRRAGRGIAAGRGKTAGRGTKGQNSRTGGGVRIGFEGGQNPLARRIPKLRGFTSFHTPPQVIYTGQLDALKTKAIDNHTLFEAGLVTTPHSKVKLVIKGELKSKVAIKLQGASTAAQELVQKAGGTFTQVPRIARVKQTKNEKK